MCLISAFLSSLVSCADTSPMRRTHPLRQPSADTSPNSMGELAPKEKVYNLIAFRCGTSCLDPSSAKQVSASQNGGRKKRERKTKGKACKKIGSGFTRSPIRFVLLLSFFKYDIHSFFCKSISFVFCYRIRYL